MNIKGRVALITGSGSGIGRGTAKAMAERGAKVVVNDVVQDRIDEVVGEINVAGGEAMGIKSDITNKTEVENMFKKVVDAYGRIDILVNNAGIARDKGLLKLTEEDWDVVLNVNLKAVFLCTQQAVTYMREQNYGRIISIASRAWLGWPTQANYAASKGGMVSFTRALALELAKRGITVNCIPPGLINTPLWMTVPEKIRENLLKIQPTGTIGDVYDIARTVIFLASDEASYITGQILYVCGGKSIYAAM